MGGPRAPSALRATSRYPGSRTRRHPAATINAAASAVTAVSTAKRHWPTISIEPQQSTCDATAVDTTLASTGWIPTRPA
jgi:hypothetical protein